MKIANFFERVIAVIRYSEYSVTNLLGAVIGWTVVLIPASFVADSMVTLGYGGSRLLGIPVSLIVGFNTAVLGILTTTTFFMSLQHNRKNKRAKLEQRIPRWQFFLMIVMYFVYLGVVIAMVVLHNFPDSPNVRLIAHLVLTVVEIPATVIAAVRQWQTNMMISEISHEGTAQKHEKNNDVKKIGKSSLTNEDWAKIRRYTTQQIVNEYGGTLRRAQQWKEEVGE